MNITNASLDQKAIFTGTQVNYYFICPTKLWFFSKGVSLEKESELVELGKLLHEMRYGRVEKDIRLEKIAFDFVKKRNVIEIHEIKKTDKMEKADYWQVVYYLYYLSGLGIKGIGFIHYPKKLKIKKVVLNNSVKEEMMEILEKINEIVSKPKPPRPIKKSYCKRCAYYELCWS